MYNILPYWLLATAALTVGSATVYLIGHGEKPSNGSTGLGAQGLQRAQCLRSVFDASSGYDIGYIIAETPKNGNIVNFHLVSLF